MEIRNRVSALAGLMDQSDPGWHRRIDRGALDLGNAMKCVLGQRFGSFSEGLKILNVDGADSLGFSRGNGTVTKREERVEYAEITEMWDEEIELRLLRDEMEASAGMGVRTDEELCYA